MTKARGISFLAVILLPMMALTSCNWGISQSVSTPTPTTFSKDMTDEQAILNLLHAEGKGVENKDMQLLSTIWADDALVVDAKRTPDDASDDTRWEGIDAVMNRYVTLVFPGNPSLAGHPDVNITISDDQAIATSSTQIGGEYAPTGDRWRFVRINGRWYIQSLVYNLESEPK